MVHVLVRLLLMLSSIHARHTVLSNASNIYMHEGNTYWWCCWWAQNIQAQIHTHTVHRHLGVLTTHTVCDFFFYFFFVSYRFFSTFLLSNSNHVVEFELSVILFYFHPYGFVGFLHSPPSSRLDFLCKKHSCFMYENFKFFFSLFICTFNRLHRWEQRAMRVNCNAKLLWGRKRERVREI